MRQMRHFFFCFGINSLNAQVYVPVPKNPKSVALCHTGSRLHSGRAPVLRRPVPGPNPQPLRDKGTKPRRVGRSRGKIHPSSSFFPVAFRAIRVNDKRIASLAKEVRRTGPESDVDQEKEAKRGERPWARSG